MESGVERQQSNTSPRISNQFLLEACAKSSDATAKRLVHLDRQGAWEEIGNYVKQHEHLTYLEAFPNQDHSGWPHTVAELAMLCLIKIGQADSQMAVQIVQRYSKDFLENLKTSNETLLLATLYLFHYALYTASQQEDFSLRDQLATQNAFEVILPYYRSDHRKLRSLASHVCPLVYWKQADWQKLFIKAEGHCDLAQLIARDGDDENVCFDLLGDVLDLVYVRHYAERKRARNT